MNSVRPGSGWPSAAGGKHMSLTSDSLSCPAISFNFAFYNGLSAIFYPPTASMHLGEIFFTAENL